MIRCNLHCMIHDLTHTTPQNRLCEFIEKQQSTKAPTYNAKPYPTDLIPAEKAANLKSIMHDGYLLPDIILIGKLFVIEAKLLNKIGRHLLHLIIRKGLANPGPMIMI